MPDITIEGSRISLDKKKILVKEVTDAVEKAYGFPRGAYTIYIKENGPENVSVGGELVVDKYPMPNKED